MGLFNSIRMGSSAAGDYEIERSLRFNKDDNASLTRTPSSAGNRRTFTLSVWVKKANLTTYDQAIFDAQNSSGVQGTIRFGSEGGSDNKINVFRYDGGFVYRVHTSAELRDPSAWYHLVIAFDTTQATASNRIKIYQNGVQLTDMGNSDYPSQNYETPFNDTLVHTIGRNGTASNYFDGYLAEFNFIDGSQLTPSSFGKTDALTGQWIPKKYGGSYGTNGFYLNFSDNSNNAAIGTDYSGNNNTWTVNNISSSHDTVPDTPTNNFPTWNPLYTSKQTGGTTAYSDGNLKLNTTTASGTGNLYPFGFASFGATSGKWYAEFVSDTSNNSIGIANNGQLDSDVTNNPWGGFANTSFIYTNSGEVRTNDGNLSNQATYGSGDIIGVAMDLDNMKLYFHKNGTYINSGNPSTGSNGYTIGALPSGKTGEYIFTCGSNGASSVGVFANFGQDSTLCGQTSSGGNTDANGLGDFKYTVPTGYNSLCTANLPDPSIAKPNKHFDTLLYTGDGGSNRQITGLEFQPDLLWFKIRSETQNHDLYDSVRGGNKRLIPNTAEAEASYSNLVQSFNSNGFNIGSVPEANKNGADIVAWSWKGGGSASSNGDGSITSSVSANTSAGFSIAGWTGTNGNGTVGHGLGVAPKVVIVRRRDSSSSWVVYHAEVGNTKRLILDENYAQSSASSNWFNNTSPTSTTFSVGSDGGSNGSTDNYIAYCFSEVAGYSKFGLYTGNGSSDGTFVFTGFRPAFILWKRTDDTKHWCILDNKRDGYNPTDKNLHPNLSNAEGSSFDTDFCSNGFKVRNSGLTQNASGGTYIYLAFAESPYKYSRAR